MNAIVFSSLMGFNSVKLPFWQRVVVGAVRQHAIVQAYATWNEALLLRIVAAVNQPHELGHDVDVIPGRPERVLAHKPALGGLPR